MEFVRLLQSKWIDWDINIFDEEKNIAAQVRTTTLNEELGQIEYIFSDKTGTLTQVSSAHLVPSSDFSRTDGQSLLQNVMTFKKCSIRGEVFGYVFDERGNDISDVKERTGENGSTHGSEDGVAFAWSDDKLIEALKNDNEDVKRFFTLLSLCHTVMPEERKGQIFYQAQSPDENALVSAAQAFGYAFQVNRRTLLFSPHRSFPSSLESNSKFDHHRSTRRTDDRFPSAEYSRFQQRTATHVSPYRPFCLSPDHFDCLSVCCIVGDRGEGQ